ncbi:hypothetical protein RND81_11G143300 [Saponaria officinalis]|uniref:Uncharacterized protein n=1 Tax=Saponaria officinalis TaxID=3572 RepID=A0AAW1HLX1_SAPOF
MDDGGFNPPNHPSIFGNMDYDFMEQLLDEGCWLQTADGSGFLQPGPSTSRSFSLPSYRVPSSLTYTSQDESERWSSLPNNTSAAKEDRVSDEKSIVSVTKLPNEARSLTWEGDEINRIFWIEPKANTGPSTTVKDRLMFAVSQLKELNRNRDILIQIWVPVKKGLKSFLTTVSQPYFFQPNSASLLHYRDVSERYEFLADEDTKEALGLPGRVFLGKVPEWTPDVRFFRQEEYPRSKFAHQFDVRGSIALPVFEKGSGDCLGVVEIIMTTEKFNYRPEIESVCQALENVHLRSSEILYSSQEQPGKGSFEAVKPEILKVLRIVSDAHELPLAQTWASCSQQGKGGCWISDNQNALCVSTIDSACYVRDQRVLDFHKACSEHHLSRGRGGIIGKAFDTNQLCYAIDVTEYSKADYPLSHHAKMFGLRGAVAIRVRSIYHDSNDYVLEFFLPTNLQETGLSIHSRIWQTLTMALQQNCQSLQFITVRDYEPQTLFLGKPMSENEVKLETSSWISHIVEPQRKGKEVAVSLDFGEEEPSKEFKFSTHWGNSVPDLQLGQVVSDSGNVKQGSKSDGISGVSSGGRFPLGSKKSGEKRRTKAQKTISLQVLRQHFAGSLKDAAKNIGVCPTTLKRICRQHGIARWPSRKIKKVGHSLKKLQLVIDSVQGAEGSIQLSSFYTKFPELNSPNIQLTDTQVPRLNLTDQSKQQPTTQAEGSIFSSGPTTSNSASTSSSQTSTSSHCFPSGSKISSPITTEDLSGSLKRARSEAELQILATKEHNKILERTQSSKTRTDHPRFETLPCFPVAKSWPTRDAGVFKAKATFGEEKVRFTVLPNMGFQRFQQEIATRFNLVDMSMIGIKYLDDDHEWVLLTCDADLEECIDIHRSTGSHTIRLALSHLTSTGGFTGSRGFP